MGGGGPAPDARRQATSVSASPSMSGYDHSRTPVAGLDPTEGEVTVRNPVGGEWRDPFEGRQPVVDPAAGAE